MQVIIGDSLSLQQTNDIPECISASSPVNRHYPNLVMLQQIYKYPRTRHIEGSRLQPGDEDLDSVPFAAIKNKYVVVEEKVDGANAAISFSSDGQLLLQSRGHYLTGGAREKHFNLFKQWAYTHATAFWQVLGDRYILFGEWLYAKHTVFYDALPHYFLEYDVLDLSEGVFLSTSSRQQLLAGLPLFSVPVLFAGKISSHTGLISLLGKSNYQTAEFAQNFPQYCAELGLDAERAIQQTDLSGLMEGLYIKVETQETTSDRYKYVRYEFLTTILHSETHWLNRPIIPNLLHPGADLFAI